MLHQGLLNILHCVLTLIEDRLAFHAQEDVVQTRCTGKMDVIAAGFSVPTQVYFVSNYGQDILLKIKEFKIILGFVILGLIIFWIGRKIYQRSVRKKAI